MPEPQAKFGASKAAISQHYDLSNDFYELWLDEHMLYTGAYYPTPELTLEQAQIEKLDLHIKQAALGPNDRLLDIGCGWGGLMKRAADTVDLDSAMGLTLSDEQARYIEADQGCRAKGIRVQVQSWEDHLPERPYDAIISLGAFEHFARLEHSEADKVDAYARFFRHCQRRLLKPGGYMSLQTFAYGSTGHRKDAVQKSSTQFLASDIFPETDPPHLSNIASAIHSTFELVNLRNDRLDYARTLTEWAARLKKNRERACELVGEETVRKYELYLKYSAVGFQTGQLDLYRMTLRCLPPRKHMM